MHSRRSYSFVSSNDTAELLALHWAFESMCSLHKDKVIFESSCLEARACLVGPCPSMETTHLTHQLRTMAQNLKVWSLEHAHRQRNSVAQKIADSVTKDLRLQSYTATGGPTWLSPLINAETEPTSALQ